MSERTDRWHRVEQICQSVLDLPVAERAAFLETACGEDSVLRHDVDALLTHEAASLAFLELPTGALAAESMDLSTQRLSGRRVGAFDIGPLLGAGGMGEVYRARDARLDRDVAIKILPEAFAHDSERIARFRREAKTLASLNHPHIAAIYGLEESDGVSVLVMELVEGDDLSQRIARGAIPLDEAIPIATQIAEALAAAHEHGIIHRDLKPANIKVRRDGVVKVLDFGLAKAMEPAGAAVAHTDAATIITPAMTQAGIILGTATYMAPEQARGRPVDKRADVWAFGAVLFEMLTGRRAFDGEDVAEVLGAVVRLEPDWSALSADGPPPVRTLLQRCLVKEPRERIADIAAVLFVLRHQIGPTTPATVPASANRRAWWVAAIASAAALAMAAFAFRAYPPDRLELAPIEFTIAPPEDASFGGPVRGGTGVATQLAVSPDGRHIVFVARTNTAYQIWLRPFAALVATPIRGTERGTFPFWSPDSRSIGFFADGKLKTVRIEGGPPIVLADAPTSSGGSWNRDNVILFAPGVSRPGLWRVSSAGGVLTSVTSLDKTFGEDAHRWPHFLPDGRHFFYTAVTGVCCPPSTPAMVRIGSLDRPGEDVNLFQAESSVSYASGHVLFARDESLMARPFDLETRQLRGDAFPLAERVTTEPSRYVGVSASENGTLVYGQVAADLPRQLTWFDRSGRMQGTVGDVALYAGLALSPDERRVAVTLETGAPENVDIYLIDIVRNIRSRLTDHPGQDLSPVWSPDGTRIAFQSARAREPIAMRQRLSDGTGGDELLLDGAGNFTMSPSGWSKDGFIAYTTRGSDVWVLPLSGDRKPFALAATPFIEGQAVFSPDGRWIAYMSNAGGQRDIYVQSFPGPGPKSQVSKDGGTHPVWRADSRELFYLAADGTMMAVPVGAGRSFDAEAPRALFPSNAWRVSMNQAYAVTKDGPRFLVNAMPQKSSDVAPLTVVVNWAAAIRK
jgi:eukaryotic-like serine/threonine-protein kinase